MSTTFQTIEDTELAELLASSRQRGIYDEQLRAFLATGIPAAKVNLADGEFKDKKQATVKTGFEGAVKRAKTGKGSWEGEGNGLPEGVSGVRVIGKEDGVYLVIQRAEA
jgi:hypothetical protein